jgi:hypothetical protein
MTSEASQKTAIIVHGGGMKAAFSAGVLTALYRHGVTAADMVLGTSSSSATAAYFAAGQISDIEKIWKDVADPKFISYKNLFRGEPIFDINYLIHDVLQKQEPLDTEKVLMSNSGYYIPLHNFETGTTMLFSNRQPIMRRRFWDLMRLALTIHRKHLLTNDPELGNLVDVELVPFALYREGLIPRDHAALVIHNHVHFGETLTKWLGTKLFLLLQGRDFPASVRRILHERRALTVGGFKIFEADAETYGYTVIGPPQNLEWRMTGTADISRSDEQSQFLFDAGVQHVENLLASGNLSLAAFAQRAAVLSNAV